MLVTSGKRSWVTIEYIGSSLNFFFFSCNSDARNNRCVVLSEVCSIAMILLNLICSAIFLCSAIANGEYTYETKYIDVPVSSRFT